MMKIEGMMLDSVLLKKEEKNNKIQIRFYWCTFNQCKQVNVEKVTLQVLTLIMPGNSP